jgi:hypothetical protein
MTTLPAPKQWALVKMNEMETAEMIERYIDYVDKNGRSVHLPMPFVRHFMKRKDSLPVVVSIAVLPIVLADGVILAPDGLDRERGIMFIIEKALRAVLPDREDCNDDAVREAMRFLCDEWLCDVAADHAGKCTLVAAALTLIERNLLDNRPAFFVTAGRRGGGKTTTLVMLIKAIMGIWPAAAAWSPNEEERRKAILAYFMAGLTYILWDNIPRGSQIGCPHIERSCTAAYYSDRKLGVSEMVATAASTIHLFTGNNIAPRGDLASRSLQVRLVVDRPDPENRKFKHPDPIGWTDAHSAEILRALYTILLGNPALKAPRNAAGKTRFKMWWRLVGSAVEHAARLTDQPLDFKKLFLDQEQDDEETADLANALHALHQQWPLTFNANNVANLINADQTNPNSTTLREFLFGKTAPGSTVSPKAVAKRLKAHLDAPVADGDNTLTLRAQPERTNQMSYFVAVSSIPE